MKDVIVVGAGIIGATVAEALTQAGAGVQVLDDGRPESGTAPSGGHLKPGWFGGMKREEYEPALELLDRVWGIKEEEFEVRPSGVTTRVSRVDTEAVISYPRTTAKVVGINCNGETLLVRHTLGEEQCKFLVVAAGAWCAELFPQLKVTAKRGVSFRLEGKLVKPFIKPWAPYKQVVAHQQGPNEIWVGDGCAIIPENWNAKRTGECLYRCQQAVGSNPTLIKKIFGLRPYCSTVNGDPCLLQQIGLRTWVATGAGKLGTIAAGWVANKMLKVL